jgi:hypothetical protein
MDLRPRAPRQDLEEKAENSSLLRSLLKEIRRLENGGAPAPNDQLFDRSVFKIALPTVSGARLNQYLYAELPDERPYVSKLEGEKEEQAPESLAGLWSISPKTPLRKPRGSSSLAFSKSRNARRTYILGAVSLS